MEKQLERANRAFAEAQLQKDQLREVTERLELLELAQ
jgi:hypothetical protein